MVIEVVARGASGRDGVTIKVEPSRHGGAQAQRPHAQPTPPLSSPPPPIPAPDPAQPAQPANPAQPAQPVQPDSAQQVPAQPEPSAPVVQPQPQPLPQQAGPPKQSKQPKQGEKPKQAEQSKQAEQPKHPKSPKPAQQDLQQDLSQDPEAVQPAQPQVPAQPAQPAQSAPPVTGQYQWPLPQAPLPQPSPGSQVPQPAQQVLPVPQEPGSWLQIPPYVVQLEPQAPIPPLTAQHAQIRPAGSSVQAVEGRPAIQGRPAARPRSGAGLDERARAEGRAAAPAYQLQVRPSELGEEWQTWRFLPTRGLDRWYPAGRWTVTAVARNADGQTVTSVMVFWLKRETMFSGLKVERVRDGDRVTVRVSGLLNRVDPKGYIDYAPFPGQPVEILHRHPDGVQWTRLASATTDRYGRFERRFTGSSQGEWRVQYRGSEAYAPEVSAPRQAG
ncbi:hypothetical protein GCM10023259_061820 [Thermocatellispora tengchongensis]